MLRQMVFLSCHSIVNLPFYLSSMVYLLYVLCIDCKIFWIKWMKNKKNFFRGPTPRVDFTFLETMDLYFQFNFYLIIIYFSTLWWNFIVVETRVSNLFYVNTFFLIRHQCVCLCSITYVTCNIKIGHVTLELMWCRYIQLETSTDTRGHRSDVPSSNL